MRSRRGGACRHWPTTINFDFRRISGVQPVSRQPSTRFDHHRAMRDAQFARNEALKRHAEKMHAIVQAPEAEEPPAQAKPDAPKRAKRSARVASKKAAAPKKAAAKAAP